MADIRINALPEEASPVASENVAIDGASTRRVTIQRMVDAGAPIASQAEAEAGVNAVKRMTPLTVKQAVTVMAATPAQGAKADTAVQPDLLPLNALNYGILPALGDMSAAIKSFLSVCNSAKRCAYFPAGDYNCASTVDVAGFRVDIFGDGQDLSRLVFNGATKGLKIDNSGLASDQRTINISDLGILTTGQGVGVGIEYIGSPIEGGDLRRSIVLKNSRIAGTVPANGWEYCLKLSKALNFVVTNNFFSGAAGVYDSAPTTATKSAIYFGSGTNIGEVANNIFDWVYSALKDFSGGTFSEGVNFHHNTVRASIVGVDITNAGQAYWIVDNHFDVVEKAVHLGSDLVVGQNFSNIRGNFILRSEASSWGTLVSPVEFCAIDVNANYCAVQANIVWVAGDTPPGFDVPRYFDSTGIRIASTSDADKQGRCVVDGNVISGMTTSIHLRSTSRRCRVKNNYADDFGNPDSVGYLNEGGPTNVVEDNSFVHEAGTVLKVNVGADSRLPYAEVYITSNMVDATGDNTAVGFGSLVTASKNIGSALNLGTMTYTAPIAGVYQFTGFMTFTDATTAHLGVLRFPFSSAGDKDLAFYPYGQGMQYCFEQYMNAGETVFPLLLIRGGAKVVDVLGGASKSKFTIRLVRPD